MASSRLVTSTKWCERGGTRAPSFYMVRLRSPYPTEQPANTDSWWNALANRVKCADRPVHMPFGPPATVVLTADVGSFASVFNWVPANESDVLMHGHAAPHVRAFFVATGALMSRLASARSRPVLLLNYGNEWHMRPSELALMEHALLSFSIEPSAVVIANSNAAEEALACGRSPCTPRSGECSARVHYAFWNTYLWWSLHETSRKSDQSACATSIAGVRKAMASRRPPADKRFVALGGATEGREERACVFIELLRRGVLGHAAFSSGVHPFCRIGAKMPASCWSSLGTLPPDTPSSRLLAQQFCRLTPRVLDRDVTGKNDSLAFDWSGSLFGDAHFCLTFETCLGCPGPVRYVTEKPLKPMMAWRPFVVLGAKGTLAHLRALGFRSFAPVINESYDAIAAAGARMQAALDEVERLASLAESAWLPVAHALAHNVRHLACGGLRDELERRAEALLELTLQAAEGAASRADHPLQHASAEACGLRVLDSIRHDYPNVYTSRTRSTPLERSRAP